MEKTKKKSNKNVDLEIRFEELLKKGIQIYPEIEESISISKTFNHNNDDVNEYFNLLNQIPVQISTNQFTLV